LAGGGIDTTTKAVRLDIILTRNSHNLEIFVKNPIEPGSNIIYDGWSGYAFLDSINSVWTHETHVHRHSNFGYGSHSTSYIEQFWGQIKQNIKKIYQIFAKIGYIYFFREMEFRYFLSEKPLSVKKN